MCAHDDDDDSVKPWTVIAVFRKNKKSIGIYVKDFWEEKKKNTPVPKYVMKGYLFIQTQHWC